MPKSSKKQKDKAADFSKAKLKLGKGKQQATNAVDTSFKARSIALPSQSIANDSSNNAPTTKRKLTFEDLLSHLKHYNANTRKDAIFGLRELFEEHPELLTVKLTALFSGCVRVIGDEDASVRKALLGFFQWLLPRIPKDDLLPHSPTLLLFTTSAQTHIFPEIRIDAIRFLDILLEYLPDVVVEGWSQGAAGHGRRVLEGYLGVLNAGTAFGQGSDTGPVQATSTASVILSPGSKLVVLRSLSTFLRHALSDPKHGTASLAHTPTWFLSPAFASTSSFEAFDSLIRPSFVTSGSSRNVRQWSEEVDYDVTDEDFVGTFPIATHPIGDSWTLQDLANLEMPVLEKSGNQGQSSTGINHLAKTLHPTLISVFLDSAPAVFSPSAGPPETELNMVLAAGEIARTLYGHLLQNGLENDHSFVASLKEDLSTFLTHMSPYFPFTPGGTLISRRDIKVEQSFQDLNLIYCELTSLLVLASPQQPSPQGEPQNPKTRANKNKKPATSNSANARITSLQVDRVKEYVIRLLHGEPPSGTGSGLPRPITAAAYTSLLPTIWALLNHSALEQEPSNGLLAAVVEHATKISSTSAVKRHSLDFLGRLVLLETESEYHGPFRIAWDSEEGQALAEWLLHLPKTLWELGANNLGATETILRLLLRLHQRNQLALHGAQFLRSLCSRLAPFFIITHPTRGKLPGPFTKLPPPTMSSPSAQRRLALDVAASFRPRPDGDDGGLTVAVHEVLGSTDDVDAERYWLSIMS
ncbi:hypothetical protein K474DRAFT_1727562 [Panus rudis PR-1116 ss-1]|nr:hypothetical protein K474DRAFT_1727562 [Panus rudis PR-1116 ss-1]